MDNKVDFKVAVIEFDHLSCYDIHFRTNTLRKGMNPSYPTSYGLNSISIRMALVLSKPQRLICLKTKNTNLFIDLLVCLFVYLALFIYISNFNFVCKEATIIFFSSEGTLNKDESYYD